ncbi:type II toxin-antitoxin system VapC family toxin [Rubrimonas sp.]|uniref:type II toxin-antitoxin system VapC family toxin n=1 Tax=Rubrimonas sp. TaxID=2036015 RepID=UPI002FDCE25D
MRLLLDTHALLWWLEGNPRLSADAQAAIGDVANTVLVSAASAWEIATKHRIGKLPGAAVVAQDLAAFVAAQGFEALAISLRDGARAGNLPGPHRDPFDRMLIAQALTHDLPLVSNEAVFDSYGVRRLW